MKIGPLDTKPPVAPATSERKGPAAEAAAAGTGGEASAKVALSPEASLLSKLAADPTFDTEKVERIAQAIRDGTFKINAEAIADKLIVNAEELLGRKAN